MGCCTSCCGKSEGCCTAPKGSKIGSLTRVTLSLAVATTVICLLCYFLPVITIQWEESANCWDEEQCIYNCTHNYCDNTNCYDHYDGTKCSSSCDYGCYE